MNKIKVPLLRLEYSDEEIKYIKDGIEEVLKSGFLTMADKVKEFERLFAEYCGTRFALGTNSGTSSLEIPLRAVGVEGGTVILPSNTYMATPLAAIKAGAKVIFAECQRENLQMDPDDLARKIRKDTKAVMLVHIGGIISPYIEKIQKICKEHNVPLIEDAAHAHGAEFKGLKAGNFGVATGFSFYPTKVFTTAEGGMVVTNDEEIHRKGIVLREHGKADHGFNVHTEIGDNWRFSELHAVLGLQQMKKADWILSERRRQAALYDSMLDGIPKLKKVIIPETVRAAYYKYIVYIDESVCRNTLKQKMKEEYGVALTGEVYSDPCHSQPVFKKYPHLMANSPSDKFTETDYVCRNHICLPLYPGLKDEEAVYVVDCLKKALK